MSKRLDKLIKFCYTTPVIIKIRCRRTQTQLFGARTDTIQIIITTKNDSLDLHCKDFEGNLINRIMRDKV